MKKLAVKPSMPLGSFLVNKNHYYFDELNHTVCLLQFSYYNHNGKLCHFYHLLFNEIFIKEFHQQSAAIDYLRKLISS